VFILVGFGAVLGCGVVGQPIAPEDVGVAPIIERQKRQQAQQAGVQPPVGERPREEAQPPIEPRGQDDDLPPLRPVGTR
jgi:hypothetical protein